MPMKGIHEMSDQKQSAQDAVDTTVAATVDAVKFLQAIVNGEHNDQFLASQRLAAAQTLIENAAALTPALRAIRSRGVGTA